MECMLGPGMGFTLTARRDCALPTSDRIPAFLTGEQRLAVAGSLKQKLRIR
jgi:hypothetical protein